MKFGWGPRLATAVVAIAITTAVYVAAAFADPWASISVSFSDDAKSATINSSKGISHYTVTLCTGSLDKVEVNGEILSLGVGPFGSPITSIEVKAGLTDQTFSSGASCDEPPVDENPPPPPGDENPPPPPGDENPPPPGDEHPPSPPVDEHPPAPPVDENPPEPPVDEHPPAPPEHHHPPAPPVDEHPPAPPEHHPAPPEEHPLPPVTDTPPTTESTPSTPDPTPPAPAATPTPPAPQAPFTPPAAPKKHKVKGVYRGCYSLRVSTREVTVGKRTELRVVVLRGKAPAAGIVVKIHGAGVLVTARTDKRGVAHFSIRAARAGILTVSLSGSRNCASARIGAVGAFTPPVTG